MDIRMALARLAWRFARREVTTVSLAAMGRESLERISKNLGRPAAAREAPDDGSAQWLAQRAPSEEAKRRHAAPDKWQQDIEARVERIEQAVGMIRSTPRASPSPRKSGITGRPF